MIEPAYVKINPKQVEFLVEDYYKTILNTSTCSPCKGKVHLTNHTFTHDVT